MDYSLTKGSRASQRNIVSAFLRVGLLGFGGGPSMIPLVYQEVVKRYGWVTDKEFTDILAIANALPGPIATKMPGYIGYRVAGLMGCISAVMAVILPTIVAMILLLGVLRENQDVEFIKGMSLGVVPVVMVMMGQLAWDFFNKSKLVQGWVVSLTIAIISAIAIYVVGIHPGWVIGCVLAAALLKPSSGKREVL